jgi:hypothetical protein
VTEPPKKKGKKRTIASEDEADTPNLEKQETAIFPDYNPVIEEFEKMI